MDIDSDITPAGFSRIVVGIDFSLSSQNALKVARKRFAGATFRLVHVTDVRVSATPDFLGGLNPSIPDPILLQTIEQNDAKQLSDLSLDGEEEVTMVGEPIQDLLKAAEDWNADLLVVGTHSRGAIDHFFLGSTAEKIVARSTIPVLTVRYDSKK